MKKEITITILLEDEYGKVTIPGTGQIPDAKIMFQNRWDEKSSEGRIVVDLPDRILLESKTLEDDDMPKIAKKEPKTANSGNPPVTNFRIGDCVKLDCGTIGTIEKFTDKRVIILDAKDGFKKNKSLDQGAIRVDPASLSTKF